MEINDSIRRCQHRPPAQAAPRNYWCPNHPALRAVVGTTPINGIWLCAECALAIDPSSMASKRPEQPPVTSQPREPVATAKPAKKTAGGLAKPRGRRKMNKTEAAYALILEAKKRAGEILRYEWEGVSLRWPDGMVFNPDFAVWSADSTTGSIELSFIETKGAFIEGDALVKFRAARAHWPEFDFQMWQLKKGLWTQLL